MTKFSCTIITLVLCFLVAGCSTPLLYFKSELKAWDHIARATELEKSEDYSQAAQEYALVAERYPSTSYYQTAVRKAALLNIHPSNSKMDFNAADKWLQVYLTLPVPPEEKESIRSNIALLKHISLLETKLVHISKEKDKINADMATILAEKDLLLSVAQKQSYKIKMSTQQIEKLKEMLSQSQGRLEKIKKVDLQMHTRKVNGDTNKPSKSAYEIHNFLPEANSENASTTLSQELESPNPVAGAQNRPIGIPAPMDEEGTALHSNKDNPRSIKSSTYPYTIQISSFFKKEDSIRAATESRNRGDITFTSPVYIQGKGDCYRVFIGSYSTLSEAKKTALELKTQKYPHAFISKMPFTIQIETDTSDEGLNSIKTRLKSSGFLAYNNPDNPNKAALLIGAFRTEKEAEKQAAKLRGQGFKPKVVRR